MAEKAKTVWERTTMTGRTLEDVYAALDRDLGKGAYKPLKVGGKELTDILSPYVYEALTDAFGPCGLGWGVDVVETEYIGFLHKKAKSNREYDEHSAVAKVIPWYALEDGTICRLPLSVGGSSNEVRNYAESGALTNAIGKGWSYFGVQRHIYKNTAPVEAACEEGEVVADPVADEYRAMVTLAQAQKRWDTIKAYLGEAKDHHEGIARFREKDEQTRAALKVFAGGTYDSIEEALENVTLA